MRKKRLEIGKTCVRPAKKLLCTSVSLVVFRNLKEDRRCCASGATGWKRSGGRSVFVSALISVFCARLIPNPVISTACAVGASIAAMHVFRCIHPPGGATAFTAVMGGELIRDLGYGYVFYPVLLNVTVMVLVAVCFNYPFKWRRYPSIFAQKINQATVGGEDISQELHSRIIVAMRSLDSFVDVGEEDLVYLANNVINNML